MVYKVTIEAFDRRNGKSILKNESVRFLRPPPLGSGVSDFLLPVQMAAFLLLYKILKVL